MCAHEYVINGSPHLEKTFACHRAFVDLALQEFFKDTELMLNAASTDVDVEVYCPASSGLTME